MDLGEMLQCLDNLNDDVQRATTDRDAYLVHLFREWTLNTFTSMERTVPAAITALDDREQAVIRAAYQRAADRAAEVIHSMWVAVHETAQELTRERP